jgi:hypothetical protein
MTRRAWSLALTLVLVTCGCSPAAFAPSSIAISPGERSVRPGEATDFTAAISGGLPFGQGAVRWSVEPSQLGVIDPRGHFVAGERSGVGTVTAALGSLSASANVTVLCPSSRSIGEISFKASCTGSADIYTESRVSDRDAASVVAIVSSDVAALERDFGRAFGTRALVYVFADRTSYLTGVGRILGARARDVAESTNAVFAAGSDAIVLNWASISRDTPVTAVRHELTHRLIWKITGSPAAVTIDGIEKARLPEVVTWLDEGLAAVAASTVPGAGWMVERDRAFGWAVHRTGDLKLSDLVDLGKWNERTGDKAFYQYVLAAQAVRILTIRMGTKGVVRILERIRDGDTFTHAYLIVSGFPFEYFTAEFDRLMAPGSGALPGLMGTADGEGPLILLYGYRPHAEMTVSVKGPIEVTVGSRLDDYGNNILFLGDRYPSGTYVVTATDGRGPTKTITINK